MLGVCACAPQILTERRRDRHVTMAHWGCSLPPFLSPSLSLVSAYTLLAIKKKL